MDEKPQQDDPEKPFDLSRMTSDLFGSLTSKATRLPAWTYRQIPDHPAFNPLRSALRVSTVVPRTGAGSGIGAATARLMAREGARVSVTGIP